MTIREVLDGGIVRVGVVDGERGPGMVAIFKIKGRVSCQGMLPIIVCEFSGRKTF